MQNALNKKDVSIIFVNYKTKELTIDAIKSVIEKTKDLEYEIIVVDNNSQDGSIEAIEKGFPNINIIKNSVNAGFGAANNLGIKAARGKYVFCLNTDTLLINNAIKIMFDYMEKDENQKVGACGGYLVDADNNPCGCGGNYPNITDILWKFGLRNILKKQYLNYKIDLKSDEISCTKSNIYVTGAAIFFRKSVLDEVGVFDENFFMYFEETDLCKRIIDGGYSVKFVDDAKIMHFEGRSGKNLSQRKKQAKKSELYYFRKHHPRQLWIIKFFYICLYTIDCLFFQNAENKQLLDIVIEDYKK